MLTETLLADAFEITQNHYKNGSLNGKRTHQRNKIFSYYLLNHSVVPNTSPVKYMKKHFSFFRRTKKLRLEQIPWSVFQNIRGDLCVFWISWCYVCITLYRHITRTYICAVRAYDTRNNSRCDFNKKKTFLICRIDEANVHYTPNDEMATKTIWKITIRFAIDYVNIV